MSIPRSQLVIAWAWVGLAIGFNVAVKHHYELKRIHQQRVNTIAAMCGSMRGGKDNGVGESGECTKIVVMTTRPT